MATAGETYTNNPIKMLLVFFTAPTKEVIMRHPNSLKYTTKILPISTFEHSMDCGGL